MVHCDDENGIINIQGNIDFDDSERVTKFCEASKGRPIGVFINSKGGMLHAAFEMSKAFKDHGNVLGIVDHEALSAATIALMGCRVRVGNKDCKLMVHGTRNVDADFRQLTYQEQRILGVDNWMQAAVLSEATGWDKDRTHDWVKTETRFNAKEAEYAGLIHTIDYTTPSPGSCQITHYELMRIKCRNMGKRSGQGNPNDFSKVTKVESTSGLTFLKPGERPPLVDWLNGADPTEGKPYKSGEMLKALYRSKPELFAKGLNGNTNQLFII